MRESDYQSALIKYLKVLLPDCVILKNDSGYLQGVPDLLILHNDRWAMLEVKASADSPEQPNQLFWVTQFNEMSFAAFIYPDNESEVLDALYKSLSPRRSTRVPVRKQQRLG
jgi:hypothetical protein